MMMDGLIDMLMIAGKMVMDEMGHLYPPGLLREGPLNPVERDRVKRRHSKRLQVGLTSFTMDLRLDGPGE